MTTQTKENIAYRTLREYEAHRTQVRYLVEEIMQEQNLTQENLFNSEAGFGLMLDICDDERLCVDHEKLDKVKDLDSLARLIAMNTFESTLCEEAVFDTYFPEKQAA